MAISIFYKMHMKQLKRILYILIFCSSVSVYSDDSKIINIFNRGGIEAVEQSLKNGSLYPNDFELGEDHTQFYTVVFALAANAFVSSHEDVLKKWAGEGILADLRIKEAPDFDEGKELLRVLAKHGVDVNQSSADNFTLLQISLLTGNEWLTRFLLENKADPNTGGVGGSEYTALVLAILRNSIDSVKALSEYGVDFNKQDAEGRTVAHLAVLLSNKKFVKSYRNKILNWTIRTLRNDFEDEDVGKITPANMWSIPYFVGRYLVARLFFYGMLYTSNIYEKRSHILNALIPGVDENLIDLVTKQKGLDLNLEDNKGKTVLDYAIEQNSPRIVSLLRARGAKEGTGQGMCGRLFRLAQR